MTCIRMRGRWRGGFGKRSPIPSPPRAPAPQRDRHHDGGGHQLGAEDDDHPPEDVRVHAQDSNVGHDAVEAQRGDQRREHELEDRHQSGFHEWMFFIANMRVWSLTTSMASNSHCSPSWNLFSSNRSVTGWIWRMARSPFQFV